MKTIIDLVTSLKTYFSEKDNAAKQAVEANIAPVENDATGSTHAYAIGDQLILNDVLYDVTAAIAIGDALATSGAGENISAADDITTQIKNHTITTDPTPTQGSTNPVQSGGVYTSQQNKADKVANATNGNFAGLDSSGNLTDSGASSSDFLSSSYLETSTKTTADGKDTFTFTDAAITSTSSFEAFSDVFGAPIVDMVLSGTQLTVSYNSSDNVGTCRLYIR